MPPIAQPALLDTLGVLAGTDKSSLRWDFLRHYENRFAAWRDAEFNLIEIGVGGGNSVRMWSRFFSRAVIDLRLGELLAQAGYSAEAAAALRQAMRLAPEPVSRFIAGRFSDVLGSAPASTSRR